MDWNYTSFLKFLVFILLSPILMGNWILYERITGWKYGYLYLPIGWTIGKITEILIPR